MCIRDSHDDGCARQARVSVDSFNQLLPTHPRHIEIHKDNVGMMRLGDGQPFRAAKRLQRVKFWDQRTQHTADQPHNMRVIVDDERGARPRREALQHKRYIVARDRFGEKVAGAEQRACLLYTSRCV